MPGLLARHLLAVPDEGEFGSSPSGAAGRFVIILSAGDRVSSVSSHLLISSLTQMALVSFPSNPWYLFSLCVPELEMPASKVCWNWLLLLALPLEETMVSKGNGGARWGPQCGRTFQVFGLRPSEQAFRLCLGKGSEPFLRLWGPREVELTDPRPWQCRGNWSSGQGSEWSKSHGTFLHRRGNSETTRHV